VSRVELHTHLEGSITPDRLRRLADKYGQPGLPAACLDASGKAYRFQGFQGFLDLFKAVTLLLRDPSDFHQLTLDLGQQLAADDISYAEVILSFGVMQVRRLDPVAIQHAIWDAAQQVQEQHGLVMRFLPDAVRQLGRDAAMRAWEAAATCGRDLGVVGFGLGGDETAGPAEDFADLCAEVRDEGLGLALHAGEVTAMGAAGARSVRQAVEICGAQRIGHGLCAASDPLVMGLLAARQVFVELCPRSNVATGNLARLQDHPMQDFLAAGIPCCLNTDDRTLFGLNLAEEYEQAHAILGLQEEDAARMLVQARQAAFHTP
jgi:adenosine deaminase